MSHIVGNSFNAGVLIRNILDGEQRGGHVTVSRDEQFADIVKLCACLGHSDMLSFKILHNIFRDDGVSMSVEYNIYTFGLVHQQMGIETQRLSIFSDMR